MKRDRTPLKIAQLERRKADFEQHRSMNPPKLDDKKGVIEQHESQKSYGNKVGNQENDTLSSRSSDLSIARDHASILPTRPTLLFNSFLPSQDQSPEEQRRLQNQQQQLQDSKSRLELHQDQLKAEQAQMHFRSSKMGRLGQSFQGLGISCIGGLQDKKIEEAGLPHEVIGIPYLGSSSATVSGQATSIGSGLLSPRFYGQEPVGQFVLPATPLIGQQGIEGSSTLSQLAIKSPHSLLDRSSAQTPNLMDTDVDDLVNWSKGLGMDDGDDFLFEEDEL